MTGFAKLCLSQHWIDRRESRFLPVCGRDWKPHLQTSLLFSCQTQELACVLFPTSPQFLRWHFKICYYPQTLMKQLLDHWWYQEAVLLHLREILENIFNKHVSVTSHFVLFWIVPTDSTYSGEQTHWGRIKPPFLLLSLIRSEWKLPEVGIKKQQHPLVASMLQSLESKNSIWLGS